MKYLIYLFTGPADVLIIPVLLLIYAAQGARGSLRWDGGPWFDLRAGGWLDRTWGARYAGVCLGPGGWFAERIVRYHQATRRRVLEHELVHQEQYQVAMAAASLSAILIVGLTLAFGEIGAYAAAGGVYALGFLLKAAAGWLVAWLRGEDPYRGATHEESAYAQTEGD